MVTLYDLLKFETNLFLQLSNLLREMETLYKISLGAGMRVPDADRQRVNQCVAMLHVPCKYHGLVASRKKCKRILDQIERNSDITGDELYPSLRELRERIEDELSEQFFLNLEYKEAHLYTNPVEGWEAVCSRFPEMLYNVQECSKCFALERYGAAVFHVLQVAEYGVIQVADLFGLSGDKPGWGSLKKLSDLINDPYPKRTPDAQKHSKLLEHVIPLTIAMNDAWRHKLDHVDNQIVWVDTDFSPSVAEEIISATRAFMRKLASELPETI